MTPRDFAERYLHPFRIHGDEIVPLHCPFCKGGERGDKHTFALHAEKGTWNCKRGSCGKAGTFRQLLREFGELSDTPVDWRPRTERRYEPPKTKPAPPPAEESPVARYLKKRGFSRATWERRGVFEHEGNVAMPYYENGKLVLLKFRPARKVQKGERKSWRESGGKPVFWGMDLCDPSLPLVITEGEMDTLALDEAGVPNAVSVPSGNSDLTCIDECWDWLEQFREIVIWPDNDEPGHEMLRKMVTRFGAWRCRVVQSNRKDANEVLVYDGPEAVRQAVEEAPPVPMQGLIRLADVETYDPFRVPRVLSGIGGIDRIFGGFHFGQVSVWTGINSSGKSTLLGQLLLSAVDQGYVVCAYSGELPAQLFRFWIDLQASGPERLAEYYDAVRGTCLPKVPAETLERIRSWYADRFYLYDAVSQGSEDDILRVFEYAARRHDARVFLIDNLMTAITDPTDYYRRQSEFVGRVVGFARQHDVHVHLVAHPRKSTGRLTKMDVAGSGDITNRADNVLSVHRIKDEERSELPPSLQGCDTIVEVFKSRFTGKQEVSVGLRFDDRSRRFYMPSDPEGPNRRYGWDRPPVQLELVGEGASA